MEASIVDLRYKTSDILQALDHSENVTILYHGKARGIIKPVKERSQVKITDHPFFGMRTDSDKTVLEELGGLRTTRYDL